MSHKPFKLKEFTIHQDKTAMKVGTDALLLGAWTSVTNEKQLLDIGCGTGLITLMLAQRCQAKITAIDIDLSAYQQACENFKDSKWSDRISGKHISLQDFEQNSRQHYDLIVSNPPYFEIDNTGNSSRQIARSQNMLSYKTLINSSKSLLANDGNLFLIVPNEHLTKLIALAKKSGLHANKICLVKGKFNLPFKRALIEFSFKEEKQIESELTIELVKRHEYSEEYRNLVKDYLIIF